MLKLAHACHSLQFYRQYSVHVENGVKDNAASYACEYAASLRGELSHKEHRESQQEKEGSWRKELKNNSSLFTVWRGNY